MTEINKKVEEYFAKLKEKNKSIKTLLEETTAHALAARLERIYSLATKALEKKEFANAYVLLNRWILIGNHLRKREGIGDEQFVTKSEADKVVKQCTEVQKLLRIQLEAEFHYPNNNWSKNQALENIESILPEPPKDEPQPKDEREITCSELFNLLNNNKSDKKKILIIDLRKKEEYKNQKISFKDNVVHIPEELIEKNKTANSYRYSLVADSDALKKFVTRSHEYTDVVVLLDKCSSPETIQEDSPINWFRKTLESDNKKYKRLCILKGGFQEWLTKYPNYVEKDTFSIISEQKFSDSTNLLPENLDTPQSDVYYKGSPILSNLPQVGLKAKGFQNVSELNSNIQEKNEKNISVTQPESYIMPMPSISPQMINHNSNGTNISNQSQKYNFLTDKSNLPLENVKSKTVNTPHFDRNLKPVKQLTPQEKIAYLEKELLIVDQKKIRSLKFKDTDAWALEQYVTLCKEEETLKQDLMKLKEQSSTLTNSSNLYPNLQSLSMYPRKLPYQPPKPICQEKENIQDPRPPEPELASKIQPMPQNMEIDEDDEDIYKAPLSKSDVTTPRNSGLKRSHSSPNLVQVSQNSDKKQIPEVNRTTKPANLINNIHDNRPIISSKDRETRMEPVYASGRINPGITGLKNLGNSCYMNSIIQCLSNTIPLARYFDHNNYLKHLNRSKDKDVIVAEEVAQVIKALWRGQYKSISPRDLKIVLGQYKYQFGSLEQQDCHEFLMYLFERMHNDLKRPDEVKTYAKEPTEDDKAWEACMNGQSSIISKLFYGQLRSTISCTVCGEVSTTHETFNTLTLSLPNHNCTLDECLRRFTTKQSVSGWKCPNCKEPRDGFKKYDISKLPNIVIIHLSRFGEAAGWIEKNGVAVDFPLSNLNLSNYLVHNDYIQNNAMTSYNLYAISNHYGTMQGGHYTAYCKNFALNKWFKYDDSQVVEVSQSTVKSQTNHAYLLFYMMINLEKQQHNS